VLQSFPVPRDQYDALWENVWSDEQ
jgi:hypothetical protein